jgi:hypothetical protein
MACQFWCLGARLSRRSYSAYSARQLQRPDALALGTNYGETGADALNT